MCGLAGFIDFSKHSTESTLKSMTDTLIHRGPDSAGYWFKEEEVCQIGLGHRRLSIIDLSEGGNQPMKFRQYTMVFNGEIYNYEEVKTILLKNGRSFASSSDTEVILQAFDEWGTAAFERFIGMFSIIIYDSEQQQVFLVRDRAGVKPMHYYWDGKTFLFASELKAFHTHPGFVKEIDSAALRAFLQYGYVPAPKSIFKKVVKQKPGTILQFDLKTKELAETQYWHVDQFYEQPRLDISYKEAKAQTKEVLQSACAYRMVADVPVGVFLSSGYDSTLVTALLQSNSQQQINTFTVGVNDPNLNEAEYAKEIAKHLGTKHTEITCSKEEMLPLVDQLVHYFDEPFGDSSAIPTMLVSQTAVKHVKVALSADGGDEVFGGYNRYGYLSRLEKIKRLRKIPLPVSSVLNVAFKHNLELQKLGALYQNPSPENLADSLSFVFNAHTLEDILLDKEKTNAKVIVENKKIEGQLSRMMAYDYKDYLLNDILPKVDRATMSASLEGREPLLDHRIIELAARLPESFKIKNGTKKFILRDIVHDYVPKSMMDRPKMGFAVPVFQWLKHDLQDKIDYYLGADFVKKQNIFDLAKLQGLKKNILTGKDKHYQKLWYLLVFQMWYKKWYLNE